MPPVPKPTSTHYDMVVIGGGSGAMGVSRRAAVYGKKVVVIESDGRLGGTCVNVGCVPKKLMWHAADTAEHLREAPEYGFGDVDNKPPVPKFNWPYFAEKRDAYVRRLNGIYDRNLERDQVEYLSGHGKLVGKNEVEVTLRGEDGQFNAGTHRITADHVVIATGGRPIIPSDDKIPGASYGIDSDGFFALREQPRRVVVVGAGYIAVELAGVFNSLGSETHLLIRRDGFLRTFDPVIGETIAKHMDETGLKVHKQTNIVRVERASEGGELTIHTDKGDKIKADCLLWAIGRRPNTDNLGISEVGIKTDDGGNIVADKYQNTNVPGVYAIGDVAGKALLTPVAIAAGRRLSNRLFGHPDLRDDHMDYSNIPTVIFSHPPSGTVGLSEQEAIDEFGKDNVRTHVSKLVAMYYGMLEHKAPATIKIVVGPNERIVGLHLVGLGVDEMVQGFAVAVKMGATVKDFQDTCAIHPTLSEDVVLGTNPNVKKP